MEVLQQFTTSLTSPNVPVIHVVQHDVVRLVRARIYSGATVWPVPDGVTAGVSYTLPSPGRTKGYFEKLSDGTDACTIAGNEVTAVIAPVLTSVPGTVQAAIVLRKGDEQLSTFPFQIRVAARPGATPSPEAQPDAASTFVGKLYFGGQSGIPVPLGIGEGVEVKDNVLRVPDAVGKAYVDEAVAELRAEIRYVPIDITSIRNSVGTVELGTELESVAISWTLNKEAAAQTLAGADVDVAARSATVPGPFAETVTIPLVVEDERGATDRATTTVSFLAGVYYGALVAGAEITSALILRLSRKLQSGRGLPFTAECAGVRPVYACPTRYGVPTFTIGGFVYSWDKIATIDHTNASGHTESYDVWMHGNDVSGSVTVTVS